MVNKVSLKFNFIGKNTMKIAKELSKNQNFLRYLKYLDDTPLDIEKPNISPTKIIYNPKNKDGVIYLTKYNTRVLNDMQITLFINPLENRGSYNSAVGKNGYAIDIIIPHTYWVLHGRGELRPFLIAHEISKSIDQQRITGIGETIIYNWKSYPIDDIYAGLTLFIEVGTTLAKV